MAKLVRNSPVIALIGHMCKDELVLPDGSLKYAIGGTAYNLAALAAVMETGKILPVCRLGSDMDALAEPLLALSPLIKRDGILRSKTPNVIHRLEYLPGGDRAEWNSGKQTPLPLGDICLAADAVLLNFISGSDVRLAELRRFKKVYKGLVYSDFHSLSLGYSKDQIRYHRRHPYWRDYIANVDMLQMNIGELRTIFGEALLTAGDVMAVLPELHALGPDVINITLGANGVILSRTEKRIAEHVEGIKIEREVDPTGCGDTYAAVFLCRYLQTGDTLKAATTAVKYAAAKATFSGLDGFRDIKGIASRLDG
jgi:adenosine kinase